MATLRYALIETTNPNECVLFGTSIPRTKDRTYYTFDLKHGIHTIRVESRFPDKIHSTEWQNALKRAVVPVKGIVERPCIIVRL